MTQMEVELLQRIQDASATGMYRLSDEERLIAPELKSKGWIRLYIDGSAEITPGGRLALLTHQEELARLEKEAKQHAEEKAEEHRENVVQARRSWLQFWLGLFIGWVLGGFTFNEFVTFVIGLFH